MRCQKVRSFLSAYCKNELSGGRHEAILAHLKICAECRREELFCREVEGSLGKLDNLSVSTDFNTRLLERIAKERSAGAKEAKTRAYLPGNIPVFGWGKIIPAAVTACLVIVLALSGGMNMFRNVNSAPTMAGLSENQIALDNRYQTVQPVDNPALRHQTETISGSGNFSDPGALVQHVNAGWTFRKELERANRIKSLMHYLANQNGFNYQPNQLASILTNPEGQSIVMRMPFGEQVIFNYSINNKLNNSGR